MYNKNILTPLKTFVPKVRSLMVLRMRISLHASQISSLLSQYLSNPKAAPENAQKLVYEFADNVITVLWCLS